ncbi:MAG TPA: diguanylate cyclase [Desulfuromonadales bacterium]|nr:diguanylate cyclase [Desulfuromonadales bacterium]
MEINTDLYARLQALASSLPDPILVLDYNGRYVSVMGGTDRKHYDSCHHLVGCYVQDVLPESKWRLFLRTVRKAIDTGELQLCEYQLSSEEVSASKRDGPSGEQWFQGRVFPVRATEGETPSAVWLVINISEQKNLEDRLKHLSQIDDLTGVFNRRYFMTELHREFEIACRRNRPLSLISIDVDHFKEINDRYGHCQGDKALQHLMDTVSDHLRSEDILARVGGEEFVILCPMTDRPQARSLAERIRCIVADTHLHSETGPIRMTVSIGVANLHTDEKSADSILSRVDRAMYKAKEKGRNRVFCSWEMASLSI